MSTPCVKPEPGSARRQLRMVTAGGSAACFSLGLCKGEGIFWVKTLFYFCKYIYKNYKHTQKCVYAHFYAEINHQERNDAEGQLLNPSLSKGSQS